MTPDWKRTPGLGYLVTALTGMIVAYSPTVFVEKFYLRDDMQHYHLPTFFHMGDLLRAGEFPFITLAAWHGGNLLAEHQNALFNPVSLLTYLILPSATNYSHAATALAVFYYSILATGIYALCRSYETGRGWSFVAGIVAVTNPFIVYWYSQSWFGVFISVCWLSWAWAMLVRASWSRAFFLAAVLACYLTITAGWPHTTLVLALLAILVAGENYVREGWRQVLPPLVASGCAALLAAPALLPLASVAQVSSRIVGFTNSGFLVASLGDALSISAPFYRGFLSWWGGYGLMISPYYYVAWFILPLLPFVSWAKVDLRARGMLTLLAVSTVFLVALRGPEQLGPLRWSIRFLPLLQLTLLVLFCRVVALAGFAQLSRPRILVFLGIVCILTLGTLQATPADTRMALLAGLAIVAGTLVVLRFEGMVRIGFVFTVTVAFSTVNFWMFPEMFGKWAVPTAAIANRVGAQSLPTSYLFYDGMFFNSEDPERYTEFQTGQMPLMFERAVINGYTPLGHRGLETLTCVGVQGNTCPASGPALLAVDPATGASLADLMRIDTIVVEAGEATELLRPAMGHEWKCQQRKWSQKCERALPNAHLPGNLSYVSQGTSVIQADAPTLLRETLKIETPGAASLIFARLYWPGYKAFLDGVQLPVERHLDSLVSIEVPAGATGRVIELVWHPPFFRIGLGLAALGALMAGLCAAFFSFFRLEGRSMGFPRPAAPGSQPRPLEARR